ncbi:hypothetical protein [Prevotella copri]|uniref:hypothetical protein n=1 Tax=Segatella copri TaxID=165179 RepID=UPI0015F728CD
MPDVITEAVGSEPTYQMAVEEVAFTARIGYTAPPSRQLTPAGRQRLNGSDSI